MGRFPLREPCAQGSIPAGAPRFATSVVASRTSRCLGRGASSSSNQPQTTSKRFFDDWPAASARAMLIGVNATFIAVPSGASIF